MSDRPRASDLDLDSLAEAFSQLQVAAGALTRALQPEASRQDGEWELVREETPPPSGAPPRLGCWPPGRRCSAWGKGRGRNHGAKPYLRGAAELAGSSARPLPILW